MPAGKRALASILPTTTATKPPGRPLECQGARRLMPKPSTCPDAAPFSNSP